MFRHKGLLLLLPIIVILVSGCTGSSQQAADVLTSALNKTSEYTSYTGDYALDLDFTAMGQPFMSASGMFDVWKKGNKNKLAGDFSMTALEQSQSADISVYYLPDGVYFCSDDDQTCLMHAGSSMPLDVESPEKMIEQLQELVDEGSVTLNYLGTKQIAGRTCDNIKAAVNSEKVSESMQSSIPSGLSTPGLEQALQGMSFYYTICPDQETGIPLEYAMSINMQTTYEGTIINLNLIMQMTATSLDVDAAVLDSEFKLPYPVSSG